MKTTTTSISEQQLERWNAIRRSRDEEPIDLPLAELVISTVDSQTRREMLERLR